ncbi:MAG: AAA family ATPase [Thermacetogeniaceae bacterium]|jgi:CO dehydrogenase maturation factor
MSMRIAFAGKGGTGKTTISSLLIRYLIEADKGTILAVDADPNSNLNSALGVRINKTISDIFNEARSIDTTDNDVRGNYIKEKVPDEGLTRTKDFDLLVVGVPREEGCYCIPMSILKHNMEVFNDRYDFMIIDDEAGMEYLSRQVIQEVDIMLIISDPTVKGVRTAGRIHRLAKSLNIDVGKVYLIVTKTADAAPLQGEIESTGLELLGTVPFDNQLANYDLHDRPLMELPSDSLAVQASREMFKKLLP